MGMGYFPDSLKVQPLLMNKYLALGTMDPKVLGVDLHCCTTLGVQSWPIENATPYNCSVHSLCRCRCFPVEYPFLHFIQHVLIVPSLLQCVYVYVCISVSLSFSSPSLWKSLWVYFSLCCFLLIFHLTHPSFSSLWISLTCSLSPGSSFNSLFSFNLEKDTLFDIHIYIWQAAWP